jgi:SAM-dependent methyltransferase
MRQVARRQNPDIVDLCRGDGPLGSVATERLVAETLCRRTWSLHRHVHLVAAFEEAVQGGGIETALSVGCGAGLSELFLAARHPEIRFTLTDFDGSRLETARARGEAHDLTNVTYQPLDLLDEPGDDRYDWVSSIEVLEHIDDDQTAARNLLARSRRWFWILVPFCPEARLTNDDAIRRAWERFEHYRPGYTYDTLTATLGPDVSTVWMRTCYHPPAVKLRARLKDHSDDELRAAQAEFVGLACEDLDDPADASDGGIEVLGRVPSATVEPGSRFRWFRR